MRPVLSVDDGVEAALDRGDEDGRKARPPKPRSDPADGVPVLLLEIALITVVDHKAFDLDPLQHRSLARIEILGRVALDFQDGPHAGTASRSMALLAAEHHAS